MAVHVHYPVPALLLRIPRYAHPGLPPAATLVPERFVAEDNVGATVTPLRARWLFAIPALYLLAAIVEVPW